MIVRYTEPLQGFRPVPRTGVIYVMTEAARLGYKAGAKDWANLGQGAPETGEIPGSSPRIKSIAVEQNDLEYAPVDGLPKLKEAVAELYNLRYRKNRKSKYTKDNVAICAGGRLALTRLVSTLGRINFGHFLPDYTAYEELLEAFGTIHAIPLQLTADQDYEYSAEDLERDILGLGLSAVLLSNPCNPTGKLIHGQKLKSWVEKIRHLECALIVDEFYSHYVYPAGVTSVSTAEFVEDVEKDPVVIIDGLTKNWRYPGLRLSWTVAPSSIIEGVASAGSFLDGGCAHPIQQAALQLVTIEEADKEAMAIKETFSKKQKIMSAGLEKLGITVSPEPSGAFYCWGDISSLPTSINTGMDFFNACLKENVITVPGSFFDINPGHRRAERPSRFDNFIRFSYGPSTEEINRGLTGITKAINKTQNN